MWDIEQQKLIDDNRGSFTVEAVFVMLIIIGVIMSMLYVSLYCMDQISVESEFRECIRNEKVAETLNGMLGEGKSTKSTTFSIWCSSYKLGYRIPMRFPLTNEYLKEDFQKFGVQVNVCEVKACDFVRKYDAIRSKGEALGTKSNS